MPEAALISSLVPAAIDMKKSMWKLYAALAGAAILALIIVIIVKKRKKSKQEAIDQEANDRLVQELNQEINSDAITLTQAQFSSCVNKLVSAMSGWGTNEAKIYAVFEEMNTRSDVLQLIKTFGVRESQTLNEWLHADLNTKELNHINEILSSKSINYIF